MESFVADWAQNTNKLTNSAGQQRTIQWDFIIAVMRRVFTMEFSRQHWFHSTTDWTKKTVPIWNIRFIFIWYFLLISDLINSPDSHLEFFWFSCDGIVCVLPAPPPPPSDHCSWFSSDEFFDGIIIRYSSSASERHTTSYPLAARNKTKQLSVMVPEKFNLKGTKAWI